MVDPCCPGLLGLCVAAWNCFVRGTGVWVSIWVILMGGMRVVVIKFLSHTTQYTMAS